jgi:hypothetical protein
VVTLLLTCLKLYGFYLGLRTFEQIHLKFHIYFVTAKPKASQTNIPPLMPPGRSGGGASIGNSSTNLAGIAGASASSGGGGGGGGRSGAQPRRHSPVPILQAYDPHSLGQQGREGGSNGSSLTSTESPLLGVGPHMNLHQVGATDRQTDR